MKREFTVQPLAALILGSALLVPSSVLAATEAGVVLVSSGGVKAVGSDGKSRALNRRSAVYSGDQLVTGSGARAQVKFSDGAIVGLKPNTALRIDQYNYKPGSAESQSFMSLLKGGFRTVSGAIGKVGAGDYKVTTPVATIGIRGTLWDGEYDPETGLDLAVWDGGINACNTGGCLDLGGDVDFRYGRVNPDGTMQGLRESPIDDEDGDEEESDESVLGEIENDMLDEDIVLFLPGEGHSSLPRDQYPLTGFGIVGSAEQFDTSLLRFDYGRFDADEYANIYGGGLWAAFRETTTGEFLVPGAIQEICDGPCFIITQDFSGSVNQISLGQDPDTDAIMGYWYSGTMSLHGSDSGPTQDAIQADGMFVLGDYAAPAVVATLSGATSFSLTDLMIMDSSGYASTVDGMGSMTVNLGTGQVTNGNIDFFDTSSNSWNLDFTGTVNTQGMSLAMTTDTANATSGSYYVPVDGSAGSELPVQGSIEAAFIGQTAVEGAVGAFTAEAVNLVAEPALTVDSVKGVFVMTNDAPPIIVTEPPLN